LPGRTVENHKKPQSEQPVDLAKIGNKHLLKRSIEQYHYRNPHSLMKLCHNKTSYADDHFISKCYYDSVVLRISALLGTSIAVLTHGLPYLSILGACVF
jgi:hypothetical protein